MFSKVIYHCDNMVKLCFTSGKNLFNVKRDRYVELNKVFTYELVLNSLQKFCIFKYILMITTTDL